MREEGIRVIYYAWGKHELVLQLVVVKYMTFEIRIIILNIIISVKWYEISNYTQIKQ